MRVRFSGRFRVRFRVRVRVNRLARAPVEVEAARHAALRGRGVRVREVTLVVVEERHPHAVVRRGALQRPARH